MAAHAWSMSCQSSNLFLSFSCLSINLFIYLSVNQSSVSWLVSHFFFFSIFLYVYLSVSQFIHLSTFLSTLLSQYSPPFVHVPLTLTKAWLASTLDNFTPSLNTFAQDKPFSTSTGPAVRRGPQCKNSMRGVSFCIQQFMITSAIPVITATEVKSECASCLPPFLPFFISMN